MASRRYFAAEMHFAIKTQENSQINRPTQQETGFKHKNHHKKSKKLNHKRLPAYYRDKLDIVRFL